MSGKNFKTNALRLKPGMELKSALQEFVNEHKLSSPFVMTCVGSLSKVSLRFATNQNGYEVSKTFEKNFEILNLSGTLTRSNEAHLHISLADENGTTIGGHLLGDAIVQTTAEVVIGDCGDYVFERHLDSETKFKELKIVEK